MNGFIQRSLTWERERETERKAKGQEGTQAAGNNRWTLLAKRPSDRPPHAQRTDERSEQKWVYNRTFGRTTVGYHRIGMENEASETRRTTDAAARFRECSQRMRRVSIGHLEANETGGEREGDRSAKS